MKPCDETTITVTPPHQAATEQRWLDDAEALALVFSKEVNGADPASHRLDQFFVRCAAMLLWGGDGWPCWSALDVTGWLNLMRRWQLWPELGDNAIMSLLGFYSFLVKHGHVSRRDARRVMSELEALAAPIIRRVLTGWHSRVGDGDPQTLN